MSTSPSSSYNADAPKKDMAAVLLFLMPVGKKSPTPLKKRVIQGIFACMVID